MKPEKGDYGYLTRFKKKRLGITLLLILGMAVMIGFGYWRYHTMKTIFTVVGILFSLPIAKILSGLIVVLPLKSISKERQEEMENAMSHVPKEQILWDLALASTDKVRYFPCVVCSETAVLVFYEKEEDRTQKEEAKKYFRNLLRRNSHRAEFMFFTEEEKFMQQVKALDFSNENIEEIKRIRETILVYEM